MVKIEDCPPTDMFDYLKDYHYILLTGPHRAGTTIAAVMIANDLGIEYYEEEDVLHWSRQNDPNIDLRKFFDAMGNVRMILRCPAFCHYVHDFVDVPDLAVVMLIRPIEEIKVSQHRVRFGYAEPQMKYYPGYSLPVARAKYEHWFDVQKDILGDRAYELEYHDLKKHPLWIPKAERAEFTIRQTKIDDPRGPRYQLLPHEFKRVEDY